MSRQLTFYEIEDEPQPLSLDQHAPSMEFDEWRMVSHCLECSLGKYRETFDHDGLDFLTPDRIFASKELEVDVICNVIRMHLKHSDEVWPDEIPGPGNSVGRAFARLKERGVIEPRWSQEDWRPSTKKGSKRRKVQRWVIVKREEVEGDGKGDKSR